MAYASALCVTESGIREFGCAGCLDCGVRGCRVGIDSNQCFGVSVEWPVYAECGGVGMGGVGVCCVGLCGVSMGGVLLLAQPEGECVEHHGLDCLTDDAGLAFLYLREVCDLQGRPMENHGVECTGGCISPRYGWMAAVAVIELDVLVVGAQIPPHPSHRAHRGVVGAGHIHVAFI